MENKKEIVNQLPEGEFCGGTCGSCRHIEWNNDYKKYWCDFHDKWVDRSDYHECCE